MNIKIATDRTSDFISELLTVWESSVRATHHFLTNDDVNSIKPYAQQGFTGISELFYVIDENGNVSGFMGVENKKIEMLFIHPMYRGNGIGKEFIQYAVKSLGATRVDVNEQNIQGVGFYIHMGFNVISRSSLDEMGRPFPILHMSI